MNENRKALLATLQGAGAVACGMWFAMPAWARGLDFGAAFFFAMSAIRHLLLAYKDGSIVERKP